jgi:hypothetical protein
MNLSNVEFQLRESTEALQACLLEIQSGTLSAKNDSRLSEHLARALDRICLAWHSRDLATHEVGHMSRADIDRWIQTVPNFGGTRQIGDATW